MTDHHTSEACPFCGKHLSEKQKTGFYVHPNNDYLLSRFEFDDLGMEQWERRVSPFAVRCGEYSDIEREHLGDPDRRTGIYTDPGEGGCTCERCMPQDFMRPRMILCAKCGNKRCPHATDHRNACTNSNEPGQKGSSWEGVKPWAPSLPNEREGKS